MQVLCTLPEVCERYNGTATEVFKTAPEDIASDFPAQVLFAPFAGNVNVCTLKYLHPLLVVRAPFPHDFSTFF